MRLKDIMGRWGTNDRGGNAMYCSPRSLIETVVGLRSSPCDSLLIHPTCTSLSKTTIPLSCHAYPVVSAQIVLTGTPSRTAEPSFAVRVGNRPAEDSPYW